MEKHGKETRDGVREETWIQPKGGERARDVAARAEALAALYAGIPTLSCDARLSSEGDARSFLATRRRSPAAPMQL